MQGGVVVHDTSQGVSFAAASDSHEFAGKAVFGMLGYQPSFTRQHNGCLVLD
jgi:hypothetical protein